MSIQKRLISLILVLTIAFGLANTAFAAEAATGTTTTTTETAATATEETTGEFKGEIKDGILVKYTGDKYALTAGDFPETITEI